MSSEQLEQRVRARLDSLTKPPGSLGRLEDLAVRFALIRGEEMPSPARKAMYLFCGDHGVTAEGVSPYPASVTGQMMRNFCEGGAAINVLCRRADIRAIVVNTGASSPAPGGVVDHAIAAGTRNFAVEPAMTREQAKRALEIGAVLADAAASSYDLAGLGEMGIGNTTTAAALFSALSGMDPAETVGAGTGAPPEMIAKKIEVIRRALGRSRPDPGDPIGVLSEVGGFEFGAMAGFILQARARRLPVVLDGYPVCAAALLARAIDASSLSTCIFSHVSAERGHSRLLEELGAEPLFDLGMRLGEGTGAAIAMGLVDVAVRLYREMATFSEALIDGVSSAPRYDG